MEQEWSGIKIFVWFTVEMEYNGILVFGCIVKMELNEDVLIK